MRFSKYISQESHKIYRKHYGASVWSCMSVSWLKKGVCIVSSSGRLCNQQRRGKEHVSTLVVHVEVLQVSGCCKATNSSNKTRMRLFRYNYANSARRPQQFLLRMRALSGFAYSRICKFICTYRTYIHQNTNHSNILKYKCSEYVM